MAIHRHTLSKEVNAYFQYRIETIAKVSKKRIFVTPFFKISYAMQRITPVVKILLGINIAVFIIQSVLESYYSIRLSDWLGLRYIGAEQFAPYQLLTHMFLHGDFFHLLGNMYALYIFGPPLELYFDSKRFAMFYLIAGLGAAVIHGGISAWEAQQLNQRVEIYKANPSPEAFEIFLIKENMQQLPRYKQVKDIYSKNPDKVNAQISIQYVEKIATFKRNIPTVGASGAIFGILAAFGVVFANIQLILLFPPVPIKAKYLVIFYGLFEIYAIYQANPSDNVAHFAHVGGMLFGFILVKLWKGDRTQRWN